MKNNATVDVPNLVSDFKHTCKVRGYCCLIFMFSDLCRIGLHTRTFVVLANQLRRISKYPIEN